MNSRLDRRLIGCFQGLATGDAIGKQTETLTRADIHQWHPGGITGFQGKPGDVIPRYAGKRCAWRIGETTDDTEQTLAVARVLLRECDVRHEAIGAELLTCQKSIHPGVSMWAFVQARDPTRVTEHGDGCGAAMRVAPVGVLYPPDRLDDLVRGAYECSVPTHGGQLAICAAVAVAGAVSAAVEGCSGSEVLMIAIRAAREVAAFRDRGAACTLAESIESVYADLSNRKRLTVDEVARRYFPDKPHFIVPLAIALALITQSAEKTALFAANLGGDSDSVASIGGAVAGSLCPETVKREWCEVVSEVNGGDLDSVATSLASLRHGKPKAGLFV